MNRYEELKEDINNLIDGWTEKADDILKEMFDRGLEHHFITIGIGHNSSIRIYLNASTTVVERFTYHSKCEKAQAFREALIWLLDKSPFGEECRKSLVGKEVKAEIEGKIYKVKVISKEE